MARNPGQAHRLMIEAAKKIVMNQGCTGLRVRDVARKARVNLGMFHYHFRSKERFTQILLQEYYEEFFQRLQVAVGGDQEPLAQLRRALQASAFFAAEERAFYFAFCRDLFNENPQVVKFASENIPRHLKVFRELIERCQSEGKLLTMPLDQAMAFLMAGIHMPSLVAYGMVRRLRPNDPAVVNFKEIYSQAAIVRRVDLALKGLRP